jgi:integrase
VLSDSEIHKFWAAFENGGLAGTALKLILLLGQRPGEVRALRREHLVDGWWEMPGKPVPALSWPGTKNGENHRVWLPEPAREIIDALQADGLVLAGRRGDKVSGSFDRIMQGCCREHGISQKATPHDLRRTHGTTVTGMGFGRDAMNRIQNHKEGGIGGVYDRYEFSTGNGHHDTERHRNQDG